MTRIVMLLAAFAVMAGADRVLAHHSFSAEYDSAKRLQLKGKMVGFEWVNPHSWIHVEVTNPDGTKTLWKGETPPINVLYRNGWTKPMVEAMVKKGEIVTLTGSAARDDGQGRRGSTRNDVAKLDSVSSLRSRWGHQRRWT